MSKLGENANTRNGGRPAEMKFREIVADPNGNREQRRAWKRAARGGRTISALVVRPDERDGDR